MRTTEARLLRTENVDFERGVIDIQRSKGYDQHYVVMHDSLTNLMIKYDRAIAELQPSSNYFFQSCKGSNYCKEWVGDNFRTLWKKSNGPLASPVAYDVRHHYAIVNINSWIDDGFEFSDKLQYIMDLLKRHLKEQEKKKLFFESEYKDYNLVCCKPNGEPINPSNYSHTFGKLLKQ